MRPECPSATFLHMYPSGVRQQKLSKSCQNRFSISKPLRCSAYRRTADVAVADKEDFYLVLHKSPKPPKPLQIRTFQPFGRLRPGVRQSRIFTQISALSRAIGVVIGVVKIGHLPCKFSFFAVIPSVTDTFSASHSADQ